MPAVIDDKALKRLVNEFNLRFHFISFQIVSTNLYEVLSNLLKTELDLFIASFSIDMTGRKCDKIHAHQ